MLKVAKFGGSSMADAAQFQKVKNIILSDPSRKVVVVSAPGKRSKDDHKITDLLYLCHAHVRYGVDCSGVFQLIADRYLQIRDDLGCDVALEADFAALKQQLDARQVSEDLLASRGEYFSAKLMAAYLGYDFVDAADWIQFRLDDSVDQERSYAALQALIRGNGIVIPGFYGKMPDGQIRTFSRGGSDITGALAAAALDAAVYENWTDVSGILMADPRIVPQPKAISQITYDELRELSYSGAQVLHEATIFPVRENNIPLNIRNTNAPDDPGTMIQEEFVSEPDPDRFITGITGKRDFTVITMSKRGLSNEVGALRKMLAVLEKYNVGVDFVPSSIDKISVVMPTASISPCLYAVLADLQQILQPDNLEVHDQVAIVAAVGRKMAFRPGISGQIFAALGQNGINIRLINQGPDELTISLGVDNKDFEKTIKLLYDSFVK